MRLFYLLAAVLFTSTACAQLPVADSLLVRETDHSNSYIFPMGQQGFVLLYKTQPIDATINSEWHWVHYNAHLQKEKDTVLDIPKKINLNVHVWNEKDGLFVFYQKKMSTDAGVYQYKPEIKKLVFTPYYVPGSVSPEKMVYTGSDLFLSSSISGPTYVYDLGKLNHATRKYEMISLHPKNRATELQIFANTNSKNITAIRTTEDKRGRVLAACVLDSTGQMLSNLVELPRETGKWPKFAQVLTSTDSTLLLAGTYTDATTGAKYGLFSCMMSYKKLLWSQFMPFTYFDNFYNNLDDADRTEKINERIEEKERGKDDFSWANLMEHGFYKVGEEYCFVAEKYTIYTSDQWHNINVNQISFSFSTESTDGYQTVALLTACLTADGKLKWNHMVRVDEAVMTSFKQPIAAPQPATDLLTVHTLTYDEYIKRSFLPDGTGFEKSFPLDNGARVKKREKLQGSFETAIPLTESKMLLVGKMGSRPTGTGYLKPDPVMVFYIVNLF